MHLRARRAHSRDLHHARRARWSGAPLLVTASLCLLAPSFASAAPQNGVLRAGAATIATAGATTTITQSSERAVVDWRSFDVAAGERVDFVQPGAQSAILNRVTGPQFSSLQGTITANGQVYLVNPNGTVIGSGARIDAGSFVASTANLADDAFMLAPAAANGRYAFDRLTAAARGGTIVNEGTITVADGGLVALVAPGVRNSGTITARLGRIELASATYFTLDLFGDSLVRLAVGDSLASQLTDARGTRLTAQVGSSGTLQADGGRIVLLSVPAAAGVVDQAINLSGVTRARTVATTARGDILLLANGGGAIAVAGAVDVSAPAGLAGGTLSIVGGDVQVASGAMLSASGGAGGGRIVLGGIDGDGSLATRTTTVAAGASVTACGTLACAADGSGGAGDGGEIRVYSSLGTTVAGTLDVSAAEGHGAGVVEVIADQGAAALASGANLVAVTGTGFTAGFVAVLGDTLSVAPDARIDLRDHAGTLALGSRRLIADSTPGTATRVYVDDPALAQRQTEQPLLFHAYANSGNSNYGADLPALFDPLLNPGGTLYASGAETPVGTLRPNGGAPSTLLAQGTSALTPIAVTLTPAPPAGSEGLGAQVAGTSSQVADDALDPATGSGDTSDVRYVAGGRGVAQSADLGRAVGVQGADPEVFDANYHVLAPSGAPGDAQIADYLCRTPYATDGCAGAASATP